LRRLSKTILGIGTYTMASEIANQYTTLLGYYNGFHENDPTARYLLTISPAVETLAIFSIPIGLIAAAYFIGIRWIPTTRNTKGIQTIIATIILITLILLAISTTGATISDLNTLHNYHII